MASSAPQPAGVRLTTISPDQGRVVRHGLIALAVGWLAWFYWFSRAALLTTIAVAVLFVLFLSLHSTYRLIRAGSEFYRNVALKLLLSLARRVL